MLIFVHCNLCKTLDDLDIWRFMPFILAFLICSYYLFGIFHSSDYVNLGSNPLNTGTIVCLKLNLHVSMMMFLGNIVALKLLVL